MRRNLRKSRLQKRRLDPIVGVQVQNPFPSQPGKHLIAQSHDSPMLKTQVLDLIFVAGNDLFRSIRAAVVGHHDFQRRDGLRQHTLDRLRQKTGVIVGGDQDRYGTSRRHLTAPRVSASS
jgi:hypothetical protein